MRNIGFYALLLLGLYFNAKAQNNRSLEFNDTNKQSPSQYIKYKLSALKVPLDSNCSWIFSSVKFTVTTDGKLTNIEPSVGVPKLLEKGIVQAIKSSEGKWRNRKKSAVDCILPLLIIPSSGCPDAMQNNFNIPQTAVQMLKFQGEYIQFNYADSDKYATEMFEGVILSPIFLYSISMK